MLMVHTEDISLWVLRLHSVQTDKLPFQEGQDEEAYRSSSMLLSIAKALN